MAPLSVAKSGPTQPLPPRHIPQRTCIGCRRVEPKRALIRVVRTPSGEVVVDATGKKTGRGAYLHQDPTCWKEGFRKGRLGRALHATISDGDQITLEEFLKATLLRGA